MAALRASLRWVLAGVAFAVSGCCVPSLHPIYTEKDLVFEPALIGAWTGAGKEESWTFSKFVPEEKDKAKTRDHYRLCHVDKDKDETKFDVYLAKIEGRLFLDFCPIWDMKARDSFYLDHWVRAHSFVRIELKKDELLVTRLHPGSFGTVLGEHPEMVRHENTGAGVVLTASPKELQAFAIKQEKTEGVWEGETFNRKAPDKGPEF